MFIFLTAENAESTYAKATADEKGAEFTEQLMSEELMTVAF